MGLLKTVLTLTTALVKQPEPDPFPDLSPLLLFSPFHYSPQTNSPTPSNPTTPPKASIKTLSKEIIRPNDNK